MKTEATLQTTTDMVNWAEWWEQWEDQIFDSPAVLLEIESISNE